MLILATGLFFLCSCTHRPYHPEKPDSAWGADHESCELSVHKTIQEEPTNVYDEYDEIRLVKECMKAKGWQWKRTGLFKSRKEDGQSDEK